MKKVFSSNGQLIEAYNKQGQHFGQANSLFFEGNTLYSYGYHYPLSIIKDSYILINNRGYSATTDKHIGLTGAKTKNRKQVYTSAIELNQVLSKLENLNTKLVKARKPQKYSRPIKDLKQKFDENVAFLGGFYVGLRNFELIKYNKANKEQKEKLQRIKTIYNNALTYQL